jgi:8-oxo-dGTP pyrophosphatase MutT (NUDIX family)
MRHIIRLEQDGRVFNFRVASVILHGGRVLMHRAEGETFWTLPGGRVELHENAALSLEREMLEELGVEVRVERLLWVVENFFKYLGKQFYELGFYFLVALPDDSPLTSRQAPFYGDEEGLILTFQWFPLEELGKLSILPSFLGTGLAALPETTQHIVHYDGEM